MGGFGGCLADMGYADVHVDVLGNKRAVYWDYGASVE